ADRDNAIRYLAEVFHTFAEGARDYRGRLIDFVSAALKAASIPVPESEEKVWALVPKALRLPPDTASPDRTRMEATIPRDSSRPEEQTTSNKRRWPRQKRNALRLPLNRTARP